MKKILIIILILILPLTALAADLFSDGFESGDMSNWGTETDTEGDMNVTEAAALHGTYGLAVLIDDTTNMRLEDPTPNGETTYRCRFYFDPNSMTIPEDKNFLIFCGGKFYLRIKNTWAAQKYFLQVFDEADGGWDANSGNYEITDEPHYIEMDWKAATGAGQNDGHLSLYVDGVLKETLSNIDSDTEYVDSIRIGAVDEIDATVSGTFYLDDFASNNDGSEIGEYSEEDNAIFFGMNF